MTEWQYGFMCEGIQLKPQFFELTAGKMAEQLIVGATSSGALKRLNQSMITPPPGVKKPAEMVSHSITQIGSNLLLTILFRHPK